MTGLVEPTPHAATELAKVLTGVKSQRNATSLDDRDTAFRFLSLHSQTTQDGLDICCGLAAANARQRLPIRVEFTGAFLSFVHTSQSALDFAS